MNFKINETGEQKELECIDAKTGQDMASDIIGNSGATLDGTGYIIYSEEEEAYTIGQEDYEWWAQYLADAEADSAKKNELFETYGYEADDIIAEEMASGNDYESHHSANLRAFDRIANDLNAN